MKKIFFFTLFTLFLANEAKSEEWVEVSKAANDSMTMYVDVDSVRFGGGYLYVWRLTDYLEPNQWGTMSMKVYTKFNCSSNTYQSMHFVAYSEDMAKGEADTLEYEPLDWESPGSGTMMEQVVNYVCN